MGWNNPYRSGYNPSYPFIFGHSYGVITTDRGPILYYLEDFGCLVVFFWIPYKNQQSEPSGSGSMWQLPWEPTTLIFWGYNPYIGGLKLSSFIFFMVLRSKGTRGELRSFVLFVVGSFKGWSVFKIWDLSPPKKKHFSTSGLRAIF